MKTAPYKILFIGSPDILENLNAVRLEELKVSLRFSLKLPESLGKYDLIFIDTQIFNNKTLLRSFIDATNKAWQPFVFIISQKLTKPEYGIIERCHPISILHYSATSEVIESVIKSSLANMKFTRELYCNTYFNPVDVIVKPTDENSLVFDYFPAPIWEIDLSALGDYLTALKQKKIRNIEAYLNKNINEFADCLRKIKVLYMNKESRDFWNNYNKYDLELFINNLINQDSLSVLKEITVNLYKGQLRIRCELPITNTGYLISLVLLRLSVVPGFESTLKRVLITYIDITDRQKAETELRLSEKRFKEVWETSSDGMRLIDVNGKTLLVNEAFCKLIGKSKKELEGKEFSIIYNTSIEEISNKKIRQDKISKFREKAIAHQIEPFFEKELYLWNGKKVWFELSNSIIEKDGAPPVVLSIFRDISERKSYENKLDDIAQKLREANAAKDKFISVLSHDLRGPFTGFLGITDLLSNSIDELTKTEIKESATLLHKALSKQFLLLDDLLLLSRIQTKRIQLTFETFTAMDEITEVLALLAPNAEHKNISLVCNISRKIQVKSDRSMFKLLFRNLIANAIKFSFRGGKILLNANQKVEEVVFSVEDNGIGIRKNDRKKIFDNSAHFSTEGTEEEPGTGLGLLLCKEIVDNHNGQIWVKSEYNKGSVFYFSLPN